MDRVERVARAMCVAGGYDPDEIMPNDGPRWRYYADGAAAAIAALIRTFRRETGIAPEVLG